MNILYLADPSSIHDLKWITYFESNHNVFLIRRETHQPIHSDFTKNIKDFGSVSDFSIRHPFKVWHDFKKIKTLIKQNSIDVFHIHYAEPNILWAIFRRRLGVPILVTTRGSDVLLTIPAHFKNISFQNTYVKFLYKIAFRKCDHISCTSLSQKKSISVLFKLDRDISVIRTGISLKLIEKIIYPDLPNELVGAKYILMPRAMRPIYNHEFTIAAIEKLPERITSDYKFVFLDSDSNDTEYVANISALIKCTSKVNFLFLPKQNMENLYTLYRKSSLVIMNPKSDGTPVSGLEAMLFERPLILGAVDYDFDIFGDWVLRLSAWDSSELTDKIIFALDRYPQSKLKIAKDKVQELGDRTKEMKKLNDLYEKLVKI